MSTLYFASDRHFVIYTCLSPFSVPLFFHACIAIPCSFYIRHHDPISFAIPGSSVYYDLGNNRTTILTILRNRSRAVPYHAE